MAAGLTIEEYPLVGVVTSVTLAHREYEVNVAQAILEPYYAFHGELDQKCIQHILR